MEWPNKKQEYLYRSHEPLLKLTFRASRFVLRTELARFSFLDSIVANTIENDQIASTLILKKKEHSLAWFCLGAPRSPAINKKKTETKRQDQSWKTEDQRIQYGFLSSNILHTLSIKVGGATYLTLYPQVGAQE